ncbi:Rid family hydrolase [Methylorubrum aminovorans]|uniref:Rid family hydrolase n=1 Tax=Methylorubrum aminovorans TaxID=269069 RepID=UPI003570D6B9
MILTPDPRECPVTGRLQIGPVAGFASEQRPASNRNPRPASSEYAPAGRTLFVSGQFGVASDGQMRAEFAEQLGQAMANAEALLAAAGMAMRSCP